MKHLNIILELGYIFLYIAGFGFSDFIVKKLKFNDFKYLSYYFIITIIGLSILYTYNKLL